MMNELLYLAHRLPYPPNKGDKVRTFHEVKFLAQRYIVHLGTFVDDRTDWEHCDKLRELCGETCFIPLSPFWARVKSARGFVSGEALSVAFYRDRRISRWVDRLLRERPVGRVALYSSPMAQYVLHWNSIVRVATLADVDSDKWRQYASTKRWPLSWVYARESRKLLEFERRVAHECEATVLAATHEAEFFRQLAPESATRIFDICNGVDSDYFSPEHELANPYDNDVMPIVFTGAMDYWPNIDAVEWFAREVFPTIRKQHRSAWFYIVGMRPVARLNRLRQTEGITITGGVPDVRPYLAHAAVAVAPLRISRGIQNKVLEAMAMGLPVVISTQAAEGISARAGEEVLVADSAEAYIREVTRALAGSVAQQVGRAARSRVVTSYSWPANLERLVHLLENGTAKNWHAPKKSL